MELSVREWMIIIGVLLIVAVLLDGYRRVRGERRNRIRVTLSKQALNRGIHNPSPPLPETPPPELISELPNGGARVIAKVRRDDLKLNESVPVLMESVFIAPAEADQQEEILATTDAAAEGPGFDDAEFEDADLFDASAEDEALRTAAAAESEAAADLRAVELDTPVKAEPYLSETCDVTPAPDSSPAAGAPLVSARKTPPPERKAVETRTFQNASLPNSAAQEVIIVNVICKDPSGFKGQDLLQILLACDLRFGNMNIFHRYEKANGKGAVQFSVANLVEPGTFDLDRIDNFSTPGLCFFLALPGPDKAIIAFNYMIETAQVLVKNLQAELRDEAHSVMTQQTIEHCRQRIRDFERKQLTLHL